MEGPLVAIKGEGFGHVRACESTQNALVIATVRAAKQVVIAGHEVATRSVLGLTDTLVATAVRGFREPDVRDGKPTRARVSGVSALGPEVRVVVVTHAALPYTTTARALATCAFLNDRRAILEEASSSVEGISAEAIAKAFVEIGRAHV